MIFYLSIIFLFDKFGLQFYSKEYRFDLEKGAFYTFRKCSWTIKLFNVIIYFKKKKNGGI